MLDTVVLAYKMPVSAEYIDFWDWNVNQKAFGKRFVKRYLNVELENGAPVKCTYFPYLYDKGPLLHVEFSIPKVILGNNYEMVNDINGVIPFINNALARIEGLPPLDASQGILRRLDACYNHQVGPLVPYFIKALIPLEYSRRQNELYNGQGVQYVNDEASTKFYDKQKECGNHLAYGILRQETTLRREAVKELTGEENPILYNLSLQLLAHALEKDLDKLGLLGCSIGTKETTLEILSNTYGPQAGIYYFGLLCAKTRRTKAMILSETNLHPRSLDRQLKKIVEAGIPLTLTETEEPLPPLVIDINNVMSQVSQVLVS